ncbi:MAG: PQQ-binding-like beta-propeller repeat protein [Acidobacteria bacterium]|nr:PQQ-binding-like beta-propeller repeat protein [Acidobacteriota bacterium]
MALSTVLLVFLAITAAAPQAPPSSGQTRPRAEQPPFPDQRRPEPPPPSPPPGQKPPPPEEPSFPGQIRHSGPLFRESPLEAIGRITFPVQYEWVTLLPGSAAAPPAYEGDRAYLSLRSGQFICVDLRTGLVRWARELASTYSPATGGDLVFVDADDAIHALEMETGRDVWELPLPGGVAIAPLWDTGWLILATSGGDLIGVRGNDGQIVWRVSLGSPAIAAPAPGGDRLYVALEDRRVVAAQLADGAKIWEFRLNDLATGVLADQERVYVGSKDNFLYCLLAKNGRYDWRQRTGGDLVGAPIMDRSNVYVNSLDNLLRAYERKNGALRWKRPLPFRPASSPIRVGDVLLVSGLASEFRAFDTAAGAPAGVFRAPDDLGAPLHALESLEPFDSRVILLLGSGQMMALQQSASPIPTLLQTLPGEVVPLEPAPQLPAPGLVPALIKPGPSRPER